MEFIGSGSLFPESARKRFLELTRSRYGAMMTRLGKKKLIDPKRPPFTVDQLRLQLLEAMGGKVDGFVQCRYCHGHFGIEDISMDHEIPLARSGGVELSNIGFPCMRCNFRKGELKPGEFLDLLDFLEKRLPLGREDVLKRLEKATQLAAGARSNAAVIGDLKKSGHWQDAQRARREAKKAKESGLGAF